MDVIPQELADKYEKIFDNELILTNILYYLDDQGIERSFLVCRKWHSVARLHYRSKRKVFQLLHVFLLDRFNALFFCRLNDFHFKSPTIERSLEQYRLYGDSAKGTDEFERQFLQSLDRLYARPNLLILFEGNNVKMGKKRRWKRAKVINAIRSKLPHECQVVGIDAHYGIIGESSVTTLTDNKDPLAISYDACGLFAISCFLLPRYRGVTIQVFDRVSELENIPPDIKAIVLFSSGVSCKGEYLTHPPVEKLLEHLDGKLALAGAQVNDKLVTNLNTVTNYSDDTANYFFTNGRPPYNPMFNPKKMSLIGIQFSGQNFDAASISIQRIDPAVYGDYSEQWDPQRELDHISSTLAEFKSNLTFDCEPTASSHETLAFLFFNYDCYRRYVDYAKDINAGISIFYSMFPKTHICGILSHAQYDYNYWQQMRVDDDRINVHNQTLLPTIKSIASFVIIDIRK